MRLPTMSTPTPPLGLSWALWAVATAWCVQAVTLLTVGATTGAEATPQGVIDGSMIAGSLGRPVGIGVGILGATSFIACILVIAGQSYAHSALVILGVLGALGSLLVSPVATLVVVASTATAVVLGLTTSALDHLYPAPAGERP